MADFKTYRLVRSSTGDEGTFGQLYIGDAILHTAELPWRDNQPNISCIPAGTYLCLPHNSPKFGRVYLLSDVPGRSEILFHKGNWAGDVAKGYKSDSEGCILLGSYVTINEHGQKMVANSRPAFNRFLSIAAGASFKLEITEKY
jgi:hypothetical protein